MAIIRKALEWDIPGVVRIYERIIALEETEGSLTGWKRGIYPTERTAAEAVDSGTMFVCEEAGKIVAAARMDHIQAPEYAECRWECDTADNRIMVLHTLVVEPDMYGKGYGSMMLDFYERYAIDRECTCLRIDTNIKNIPARSMYIKHGYREAGIVDCSFKGIKDVQLICFEKNLA